MFKICVVLLCALIGFNTYSWNAMGHRLVAQIAYDNLSPKAKRLCNKYNQALNKAYPAGGFVRASIWMDFLRSKNINWYDSLHYIDIPFTRDGTPLPETPKSNALWGINHALAVLSSNKPSLADKGLALRIVIHTVGDIHQPLHTTAMVSHDLPEGDLGGNLFPLGTNPIGPNLHTYWDNGAGILIGQSTPAQIRNKAHQLEQRWSCSSVNMLKNPEQWINASHELALKQVYTIEPGTSPSKHYQLNAQNISQKQILLAGCRLAQLLNKATQ
jgi:hypothetical protein